MRLGLSHFYRAVMFVGKRTPLRLAFFATLALVMLWPCLRLGAGMNVFHDAQFLSAYERHAATTVTGFHEVPLWDPYSCGGMYGLAAPQTRYASPFFLISLLLGTDRAGAFIVFLTAIIGAEGTFRYARTRGSLIMPALVCAPLAALSGFYVFAFHFGWVQFASFELVPWMLLGIHGMTRGRLTSAVLFAIVVAVCAGFGGTYTLPMAMLPMLIEVADGLAPSWSLLKRATTKKTLIAQRLRRGLPLLIVGGILALLLGAVRFLPMIGDMGATLRVMAGLPAHTWAEVQAYVFGIPAESYAANGQYYLGYAALLAIPGLLSHRSRPLWIVALLAILCSLGHAYTYAPFALLRKLPLYETLRYPERYLIFLGLCVAVTAALGLTRALAVLRKSRRKSAKNSYALVAGVFFLGLLIVAFVGFARNAERWCSFVTLTESPPASDRGMEFKQARGNRWIESEYTALGLGSLSCGEAYPVPMSRRLRGNLAQEEYLEQPELGAVTRTAWSPNEVDFAATLREPTRVLINQNFHPGWTTSVGTVVSVDGLLGVELPSGTSQVKVTFRPRSFAVGFGISCAAALLIVLLLAPKARTLRVYSASTAGLTLFAVLALVLIHDARLRRAEPKTSDGDSVILAALPQQATPLHVVFENNLELVGYMVAESPLALAESDSTIRRLTFFWRRTGSLSAAVAPFVHVSGATSISADHPEFSGILYPSKADAGAIIRDELDVNFPVRGPLGTWKIEVGLWNAAGDGARLHAVANSVSSAASSAVLVDNAVVFDIR